MKALAAGIPNDHQCRIFLKWLIEDVSGLYDLSYRPDSERDTAFAEGKRHVASQVVKLMKIDPAVLRKPTTRNNERRTRGSSR